MIVRVGHPCTLDKFLFFIIDNDNRLKDGAEEFGTKRKVQNLVKVTCEFTLFIILLRIQENKSSH